MARGRKKKVDPVKAEPEVKLPVEIVEPPLVIEEEEPDDFKELPDPEPKPGDEKPEPEKEGPVKCFVAPGRSLSTKAGIIDEKKSRELGGIDETYFIGGLETLNFWAQRGFLVDK